MNILLLGKTGLLGSEFLKILEIKSREISNLKFIAPKRADFDVLDFEQVDDILTDNFFDLIIYCVAYANVDDAEKNRAECHAVNVEALENLIRYEIPIIHFSTDYVFSAKKEDEITEEFPQNPLNYYGQTKVEAEKLLENSNENQVRTLGSPDLKFSKWWNIRTTWLFGKGGDSFISKILEKSRENKELEIVSDEIGRPTSAKDLAEYIFAEFIEKEKPVGHYHLQNSGEPTSWANFAEFFLRDNGIKTKIKEIPAKKLNRPAKRPVNSVLKNTKLRKKLRDWKESVRDFLS
jgi:dTDP-4-dehydrorhamnose reductase